jgi:hypothetical protein
MAISHILEETIHKHIREYFDKGRIPFNVLSVNVDGQIIDVIYYEDGFPEGSANIYIDTGYPHMSHLTLTLPLDIKYI